jgi:hypothetical protein
VNVQSVQNVIGKRTPESYRPRAAQHNALFPEGVNLYSPVRRTGILNKKAAANSKWSPLQLERRFLKIRMADGGFLRDDQILMRS